MIVKYPNYKRSLLNISQSILKAYGLNTEYPSIVEIDRVLKDLPKHVMFILLDGLGVNILAQNLEVESSLRKNMIATLTSVFPPTTVAATTSFLSGKLPRTNGHIAWMQYDKQHDINTVVFRNEDYYEPKHEVLKTNFPLQLAYKNIFSKISEARPDVEVEELWPDFRINGYTSFEGQVDRLIKISKAEGKTLTYCYWTNPDETIHRFGEASPTTKAVVEGLAAQYERLISNIEEDTAIFLFADHGLINVEPLDFVVTLEFRQLLRQRPSLEGRACTFFLKEGKDSEFLAYYQNHLAKYFLLLRGKDYFSSKLFGIGPDHPLLHTFVGDYVLIAIDKYYIRLIKERDYIGHHAGLTSGEMEIPLIFYKR